MNASELKNKSVAELREALHEQLKKQVNNKFKISMDQMTETHKLKETRRNIARIKTAITAKTKNGEEQ